MVQIKHLLKWLKKVHLVEHILETFILVLMKSGTKIHGKSFLSIEISCYLCSDFWGDSSEMHFLRE